MTTIKIPLTDTAATLLNTEQERRRNNGEATRGTKATASKGAIVSEALEAHLSRVYDVPSVGEATGCLTPAIRDIKVGDHCSVHEVTRNGLVNLRSHAGVVGTLRVMDGENLAAVLWLNPGHTMLTELFALGATLTYDFTPDPVEVPEPYSGPTRDCDECNGTGEVYVDDGWGSYMMGCTVDGCEDGQVPDVDSEATGCVVLRNCWTCANDSIMSCGRHGCDVVMGRADVFDWFGSQESDEDDMPPKSADGCPGYEPKGER